MKKAGIVLLFSVYAVIVIAFGVYQYQSYQKSFDKIVPYSHTLEISPTEILPQTSSVPETTSIKAVPEKMVTVSSELPTEATLPYTTLPSTLPPPQTTIPQSTAIKATTAPIQEEIVEIPQETEFIVNYPFNLNTATFEELCTLPEIGESLAWAILNYRDQIGGFINREQLLEISGIGQYRYSAIAPLLMIENEQPMPTEPPPPEPEPVPEPVPDELPELLPTEPPEIPYINLNTTTKEQLMRLPNCTERIAETIIELREVHIHTFSNPLEILYVSEIAKDVEISPELYYSWEEYLFVDDEGGKQLYLYVQPEPE